MNYYLDLFSPQTFEAFNNSDKSTSGFRPRYRKAAGQVKVGDRFICYMTKLSRWVGVLEVIGESFEDDTPIFLEDNDPFTIRFKVKPIVWLEKDDTIPIREDQIWSTPASSRSNRDSN